MTSSMILMNQSDHTDKANNSSLHFSFNSDVSKAENKSSVFDFSNVDDDLKLRTSDRICEQINITEEYEQEIANLKNALADKEE